jgi:HTH-type transcriptional regulator / antitoxin HigA
MTTPMGLKMHRTRYSSLLAEVAPTVPRTEKENERLLAEIEKLIVKGEKNLSPEEDALLELLTQLVETFERRVYPREKTSPAELVAFLLEQRGLSPSDLWSVLGSKGRVSELLSGRREVSKDQAKRLAAFFHISPAAFI